MTIRHLTILLVSVALLGCTPAPPPSAQKQASQEQAKASPKNKDYSQPHTAWAP
jgi:hypothetical protein